MSTGSGPSDGEQAAVPDAARAVLSRVRAASRARPEQGGGAGPPSPGRSTRGRPRSRRPGGTYSGPGPDERDPALIGGIWADVVAVQGWRTVLHAAALHGRWDRIVGAANAEHAQPESFDPATGILVIRTSSTAWAEQLRLMLPALRTAIDTTIGPNVVRDIRISGPAPPRTRGRLRVRGRGPRDTYG